MCQCVPERKLYISFLLHARNSWKLMEYYWITSQQNRQTRIFSVLEESISGAFPTRMLRSRPSAEVPSTPDAEVPADMAGTCRPRLLVMPSHYFEEKPQDDLAVMTSKLGLKVAECGTVECVKMCYGVEWWRGRWNTLILKQCNDKP